MIDSETVRALEKLIGEDPRTQWAVLEFIGERYGAAGLHRLPRHVAREIRRRPGDFLKAVRLGKQAELAI